MKLSAQDNTPCATQAEYANSGKAAYLKSK